MKRRFGEEQIIGLLQQWKPFAGDESISAGFAGVGRSRTGCRTPCSRIDSASSFSCDSPTGGVVIRQKINTIRETGRVAQGVKLINLDDGDKVAAVAKLLPEHEDLNGDDDEEGPSAEDAALGIG